MDPSSIYFQTKWIDLTCTTRKTNCWTLENGSLNFSYNNSTKVLVEGLARIPWPCHKSIKNFVAISDILLMRVWIFVMAAINTKLRNSLDVRATLRVPLSSIISRWERLVAAKQAQGSHWIKVLTTYTSCKKYSSLNICGFWRPVREKISRLNRSAVQKRLTTPDLYNYVWTIRKVIKHFRWDIKS